MHPPFGFSLFYLRSVAPEKDYDDVVTGLPMARVTTGQIYAGAIPFLVIQLMMVGLLIAFPNLVLHHKPVTNQIDPKNVIIEIPEQDMDIPIPVF